MVVGPLCGHRNKKGGGRCDENWQFEFEWLHGGGRNRFFELPMVG
jgi:hypothetical protein